jgi:fumarate hydratase class II
MGEMLVPDGALWGANEAGPRKLPDQRARSATVPRALGLIKKHAAATNASLGLLQRGSPKPFSSPHEVSEGNWDSPFVVDIFQTEPNLNEHGANG